MSGKRLVIKRIPGVPTLQFFCFRTNKVNMKQIDTYVLPLIFKQVINGNPGVPKWLNLF